MPTPLGRALVTVAGGRRRQTAGDRRSNERKLDSFQGHSSGRHLSSNRRRSPVGQNQNAQGQGVHGSVLPLIEQVTEATVSGLELHEQIPGRTVGQQVDCELGNCGDGNRSRCSHDGHSVRSCPSKNYL